MAKPLRSDDPTPQNMQFAHFGVLNDGSQSKASLFTSISLNIVIALCAIIIGAAAKKTIDTRHRLTELNEPLPIKKPEPPAIKLKPLPKLPPPPIVKAEAPKIKMPDLKLPDVPKPPEIKMAQQMPVILPAPPKLVQPPPAPRVVNLAQARAASVVNNSPHPTAVALGSRENPIAPSDRPTTSAVNLGNSGMAGMRSNSGMGAASKVVNLGSGSAGSQNMRGRDNASGGVVGVKLGVAGGTGSRNAMGRSPGVVNLGQNAPPPMPKPAEPSAAIARTGPKVLFKPKPEYTAEAIRLHIEGIVSVRLRVSSSGAVQVLGVTSDLGHGLGQSAVRAVESTRFQPATDASGRPIDWEGVVNIAFQLAG